MDQVLAVKGVQQIVIDYLAGSNLFWLWRNDACLQEIKEIRRPEDDYLTYFKRCGVLNEPYTVYAAPLDTTVIEPKFMSSRTNAMYSVLEEWFFDYEYDLVLGTELTQVIYEYVGWLYPYYSRFDVAPVRDAMILLDKNRFWKRKDAQNELMNFARQK